MTGEFRCRNCGWNEFTKDTVMSCSAVPPIFSCARCGQKQNVPRTYRKAEIDFLPINDRDGKFMGHLKCAECGEVTFAEYELDALPSGWSIETVYVNDPDGNQMVRHYARCPKHG